LEKKVARGLRDLAKDHFLKYRFPRALGKRLAAFRKMQTSIKRALKRDQAKIGVHKFDEALLCVCFLLYREKTAKLYEEAGEACDLDYLALLRKSNSVQTVSH
jgi:hypothetical protein